MLIEAENSGTAGFTCSDGDVTFSAAGNSPRVEAPGSAVLPGKVLAEITRYLTGKEVTLRLDDRIAEVGAGRSSFRFPVMPAEGFPAWRSADAAWELDGELFATAVRQVTPAVSRNPPVPLQCVRLEIDEALCLVATDTSRLALAKVPVQEPLGNGDAGGPPRGCLVRPQVVERYARLAEGRMTLGWDQSLVTLDSAGLTVTARTVQGEFMPWRKLSLDPGTWISIDPQELSKAVRLAMAATGSDWGWSTELTMTRDGIRVHAAGAQGAAESVAEASYGGDEVSFLLGSQMLLDGLGACGDYAQLGFTRPPHPVLLRSGDYVCMLKPRHELREEAA
jgi:DNA polymerase-3 subunit beta